MATFPRRPIDKRLTIGRQHTVAASRFSRAQETGDTVRAARQTRERPAAGGCQSARKEWPHSVSDSAQRVLGTLLGILLAPLIGFLALMVRVDSPGPAIYRADRIGQGGRRFRCLKLRTMRWHPGGRGAAITTRDDVRVTRVGSFLRRYRLDELPQLVNVARGEMNLVGPRPEDPRYVDLTDPLHLAVFSARPGITGLTQLAFADEASLIDPADSDRHYRETILPTKLALDRDYLRRRSLRLDLWILGQTLGTALGRRTSREAIEARR